MMGPMGPDEGVCTERELTAPVALCTPEGRLSADAVGWARQPVIDCALPGGWGRRKRWDYWAITGPGFACSLTYAHVDYLGLADVWFHDLAEDRTATKTAPVPFGRGLSLAPRAGASAVRYHGGGLALSILDGGEGTAIAATFATKAGPFEIDVMVERPAGHESLTVVIPWSPRRFQCTTKDIARPAFGTIRWGDRRWVLTGDGTSWGALDFGRGRWPYRTRWNWGAGAGLVDGRAVGLQLGGQWTDGTGMTENALVVDGRLSKLSEELVWEYDRQDWLAPWRIRTPRSDRLDVTFTPAYDKVSRLQLGIAASAVDQCFGTYAGRIVPDDGDPVQVDGLVGWAEEASWRW